MWSVGWSAGRFQATRPGGGKAPQAIVKYSPASRDFTINTTLALALIQRSVWRAGGLFTSVNHRKLRRTMTMSFESSFNSLSRGLYKPLFRGRSRDTACMRAVSRGHRFEHEVAFQGPYRSFVRETIASEQLTSPSSLTDMASKATHQKDIQRA